MSEAATTLKDDLLTGADQIADYLGWPRRRIYHASRMGYLPIGQVGQILIARKSELDKALTGDTGTSTPPEAT